MDGDLVCLPPDKSVVGSHWMYKVKSNSQGLIEGFKTKLVAKGYSHQWYEL